MNSLGRKTHLNFFVKAAFKFKRKTFNHTLLRHLKFARKTPLIFAFVRAPARCCSRRRWLRPAAPSRPGRRAAGSARRRRCWPPGGSPPRPRRQSSGTGSGSSKYTKFKGSFGKMYMSNMFETNFLGLPKLKESYLAAKCCFVQKRFGIAKTHKMFLRKKCVKNRYILLKK